VSGAAAVPAAALEAALLHGPVDEKSYSEEIVFDNPATPVTIHSVIFCHPRGRTGNITNRRSGFTSDHHLSVATEGTLRPGAALTLPDAAQRWLASEAIRRRAAQLVGRAGSDADEPLLTGIP
jgi:hypothetical protein